MRRYWNRFALAAALLVLCTYAMGCGRHEQSSQSTATSARTATTAKLLNDPRVSPQMKDQIRKSAGQSGK